jgi:hypothetical protein
MVMTPSSVPRTLLHRDAAADWLSSYLSGGARWATEIRRVAQAKGYGWRTINRVKVQLGISSVRSGTRWSWSDPRAAVQPVREPTALEVLQELKNAVKATAAQASEQQALIDNEPEDDVYVPEPFAADVNWLMQRAVYFRQTYPWSDEKIERELLEIATNCPCDPPLSAEVIRAIAVGSRVGTKPAATAVVESPRLETDVVF